MAKEPQTPQDEELEKHEEVARTEPLEGELEDSVTGDDETVAFEEPGPVSDNPEADMLAAQVEALEQEVAAAKDQALRAAAETQNVRRRAEQEAEKARKFALERFVKELLSVVDTLEKALEAMTDEASEAHREGVAMTLKMQLDAMAKFGVEQIDPAGEPFDPQLHEAMAMVPNPELEPNSVMEVIQKGYQLNGRLVRPAMVVVSQAAG